MEQEPGPIGLATRLDLQRLGQDLEKLPGRAMAALMAAKILDDPDTPARDFASVLRQYEAVMANLERRGDSDHGAGILAGVLAPVGDAKDTGAADPRP